MKRIFLSYASVDQPFARRLQDRLQGILGPDFEFVDGIESWPGESMFEAVASSIRDCDVMLYIASEQSTESSNTQAELAWALAHAQAERSFEIIPILLDAPHSVPHLLREFRFLDFRSDADFDSGIETLTDLLTVEFDPRLSDIEIERRKAEANFLELRKALIAEQETLLWELAAERDKGIRRLMLGVGTASVAPIAATVLFFSRNFGQESWIFLIMAVGFCFAIFVALMGYNSGGRDYVRYRLSRVELMLYGKSRSDLKGEPK